MGISYGNCILGCSGSCTNWLSWTRQHHHRTYYANIIGKVGRHWKRDDESCIEGCWCFSMPMQMSGWKTKIITSSTTVGSKLCRNAGSSAFHLQESCCNVTKYDVHNISWFICVSLATFKTPSYITFTWYQILILLTSCFYHFMGHGFTIISNGVLFCYTYNSNFGNIELLLIVNVITVLNYRTSDVCLQDADYFVVKCNETTVYFLFFFYIIMNVLVIDVIYLLLTMWIKWLCWKTFCLVLTVVDLVHECVLTQQCNTYNAFDGREKDSAST